MIIFLHGQDTYCSKEKLLELIGEFKTKRDSQGLGIIKLEGGNLTIDEFRKDVLSAGLFSEKRLVIIKNLLSQNKDQNLIKEIISSLKKIGREKNIVIFIEEEIEEKEIRKREFQYKLFNLLKKQKYVQKFDFLKPNQLQKWILAEVKKRGGKIEERATDLLVNFIGPNLWQMSNELDKLMAYGQGKISAKDVELLVEANQEENIFNLVDALASKNKKRAIKLIKEQLEKGTAFVQIISLLARQFRIILQIKESKSKFLNYYQLASELGVHPYSVKKSLEQAKKYTLEELKKIYQELLKIDLQLKTTSLEPELLFNLLIAKL